MKTLKYLLILLFVSVGTFGSTLKASSLDTDPPDEFTTLVKFLNGKIDFLKERKRTGQSSQNGENQKKWSHFMEKT